MDTQPLVSVIIPVYNGERYLAQAIDSVLAQKYIPLEVVVVDDGSTDSSRAIAQSSQGIGYLYQSNQGAAAARNAGVHTTHGDFIAFLDADDLWLPDKLSQQMEYLLAHPDVDFTLTLMTHFLEPGARVPDGFRRELLSAAQPGLLQTMLARRAAFSRVGDLDPRYHISHDADWFARAKDAGISGVTLPEVLVRRRVQRSSLSTDIQLTQSELLQALKASIDRQRQRHGT